MTFSALADPRGLEEGAFETRARHADAYGALAREHRLIERVLDILGRLCSDALRSGKIDVPATTFVLRFLQEFADRTHHLKEEGVLFPAIEARGYFPGCGLVGEHEEGRRRVRTMAEALAASRNDPEAVRLFARRARAFVSFLRGHIAKEDECLAEVVAVTFSPEEHQRLLEHFAELDRRELGEDACARFAGPIDELETKYGCGGSTTLRAASAAPTAGD